MTALECIDQSCCVYTYVPPPQPQFFSRYFKEELDLFDIIISAQKE